MDGVAPELVTGANIVRILELLGPAAGIALLLSHLFLRHLRTIVEMQWANFERESQRNRDAERERTRAIVDAWDDVLAAQKQTTEALSDGIEAIARGLEQTNAQHVTHAEMMRRMVDGLEDLERTDAEILRMGAESRALDASEHETVLEAIRDVRQEYSERIRSKRS